MTGGCACGGYAGAVVGPLYASERFTGAAILLSGEGGLPDYDLSVKRPFGSAGCGGRVSTCHRGSSLDGHGLGPKTVIHKGFTNSVRTDQYGFGNARTLKGDGMSFVEWLRRLVRGCQRVKWRWSMPFGGEAGGTFVSCGGSDCEWAADATSLIQTAGFAGGA